MREKAETKQQDERKSSAVSPKKSETIIDEGNKAWNLKKQLESRMKALQGKGKK